ncbi:hypothetical protein V1511DRAFT_494136 [Dipodascopsis uninucleata]
MSTMKTVALISGGKDSFFNLIHCVKNGHEIVALANLRPPERGSEDVDAGEMDSFMYQTVGHSVLDLYSEAMALPIYREYINGKSVDQSLDQYAYDPTDETEDLYRLLHRVKEAHPDVAAVSVGAIFSTYQRSRVENVCSRLGLAVLAYLWMRPQNDLLDEMIQSGLHAILVKTAALGLDSFHLGKSLADLRDTFMELNKSFGFHVCGEGGEYESLVLDCPLFVKSIVIDSSVKVFHPSGGDVSLLSIKSAHLQCKEGYIPRLLDGIPPSPELLDKPLFTGILSSVENNEITKVLVENDTRVCPQKIATQSVACSGSILTISCVQSTNLSGDTTEELNNILDQIDEILLSRGLGRDALVSVTLILSDIADFAVANISYRKFFSSLPIPPARMAFSSPLAMARVSFSAVAIADKSTRSGLYVQGRSYWAPANIGPYSQAVAAHNCVYLSGQIPLVPSQMVLWSQGRLNGQAVLALQHLTRVRATVLGTRLDLQYFYLLGLSNSHSAALSATCIARSLPSRIPGFVVVINDLPMSAPIEWASVVPDSRAFNNALRGDIEDVDRIENMMREMLFPHGSLDYKVLDKSVDDYIASKEKFYNFKMNSNWASAGNTWFAAYTCDVLPLDLPAQLKSSSSVVVSVTLYSTDSSPPVDARFILGFDEGYDSCTIDVIYSHAIYGFNSNQYKYGLIARGLFSSPE